MQIDVGGVEINVVPLQCDDFSAAEPTSDGEQDGRAIGAGDGQISCQHFGTLICNGSLLELWRKL
jgi:hypothetical protein